MESAIRRIINLRFKGPSIFWRLDTVDDLMHLRAVFKSGRWDEMMYRVLTHTYPVPSFEELSPTRAHLALAVEPLDPSVESSSSL